MNRYTVRYRGKDVYATDWLEYAEFVVLIAYGDGAMIVYTETGIAIFEESKDEQRKD